MVVAERFTIVQKLGEGGHGTLFLTCDPNHRLYVLKAEEANKERCSVKSEISTYVSLGHSFIDSPVLGIPRIFYHGSHTHNGIEYYVIIMEYLERSLYDRMIEFGGRLSLKSVIMVGIQMLQILEDIHDRGFVHRDVKPENILTGSSVTDSSSLYLCDFGIAKYVPFQIQGDADAACVYGTIEFASRRALISKEQGRCDDLESLGYTLIYLMYGSLPWQGISFPPDGKQSAAVRGIYYDYLWKELPPEMKMYTEYVKSLDVREKPDYEYLRSLLNTSLRAVGMVNDGNFEWSPPARFIACSEDEVQNNPCNRNEQERERENSSLKTVTAAVVEEVQDISDPKTIPNEDIEVKEDGDKIHKVFRKRSNERLPTSPLLKSNPHKAEDKRLRESSSACRHGTISQGSEKREPLVDDSATRTDGVQKFRVRGRKLCSKFVRFASCLKVHNSRT